MKILVVEDEVRVATVLRRAFEEAGHTVDTAYDGIDGLRRALTGDYELLVLDWMLPLCDGKSLCAAVRTSGIDVAILMLTARDDIEARVAGLDAGADDYLTKPFVLDELLARVRALQRRGRGAATPTLTFADLTLDPITHAVTRGGHDIPLSAKEYALLEYLMRHARRTVTRTAISQQIPLFDRTTNVVDVYINYLRNKVDRDQPRKLIQTVRGVGYRLDDDPD